MFIPVGLDDDEVRRTPYVSYAIIGANIVLFIAELMAPGRLLSLALVPARPDILHMLTSTFLHGGVEHLVGNLIFFYVTGPFVEDAWGRVLFTVFYLGAGVVADLVDIAHDPQSLIPHLGASGAIAGVMGAFLVRFGGRRIRFLWWSPPFTPMGGREIRVPAWLYLPFWFGTSLLIAQVAGDEGGVAEWAHVGGFVFGALVALVVWASGFERRFIDPAADGVVSQNEHLLQAMDAGRAGHLPQARLMLDRVLSEDPGNLDARRYAFDLALQHGDPAEIARADGPLLHRCLELGDKDLAYQTIAAVQKEWMAVASPRFLLRAGEFLASEKDTAGALEMFDRIVDAHPNDPVALKALLKISEVKQRIGDLAGARSALDQARQHPAFTEEWREAINERQARLAAAT